NGLQAIKRGDLLARRLVGLPGDVAEHRVRRSLIREQHLLQPGMVRSLQFGQVRLVGPPLGFEHPEQRIRPPQPLARYPEQFLTVTSPQLTEVLGRGPNDDCLNRDSYKA